MPTRRKLANAAGLLDVFGAIGAFVGNAEAAAESADQPATLEGYATQAYEAWPEDAGGELASISTFLPRWAADYPLIGLALAVMKCDPDQNAQAAADLPDEMVEFAEGLGALSERYVQLGQFLRSAQLRVMAGIARHVIVAGEA